MKPFAVVILNWNGVSLLQKFLPSVVNNSDLANIYVADNASTDNSVQYIKDNFPTVKIIQNPTNDGFAGGYNLALKEVTEPYLVLVNSDIEVTPNWLEPVLEVFENEEKVAIIQPKLRAYNQKTHFEYAGAAGGFLDMFGYPYCRGRIFDTIEKDNGQYDDAVYLGWASGACFFVRNLVFKELKGFDSSFFAHQEEIDLCWRARNKGHLIKFEPKSLVYHVGGATLSQSNPKKTYLNFRNSLWMLTKNLPVTYLFPVLFVRMVLDGVAGLKFIAEGKNAHCMTILKAHASFYANFLENWRKREKKQIKGYFDKKSVVFDYYLKKRHEF